MLSRSVYFSIVQLLFNLWLCLNCQKALKYSFKLLGDPKVEIHFSSQTSKFLIEYNLLRFQISGGLIIFFTQHDYKVQQV